MVLSGTEGLYGAVVTAFHALAWMWIGLAVVTAVVVIVTIYRSRRSAWIRPPEEIPLLERVTTPIEDPEQHAA